MKKEISFIFFLFFSVSALCQPVLLGELTGKETIFTGFKNRLYFAAGSSIMVSDTTSKSIDLFINLNEPIINDRRASYTQYNFTRDLGTFLQFPVTEQHIYFLTKPYVDSISLWQSDGTPGGTKNIGIFDTIFTHVDFKGDLYFAAGKSNAGCELWKADRYGTISQMTQLNLGKLGNRHSSYHNNEKHLLVGTNYLYWAFPDSLDNYLIHKSDGTPGGTTDLGFHSPNNNNIQDLTFFKEKLYFLNNDTLWFYDHSGFSYVQDPNPEKYYNFIAKTSNHLFLCMKDPDKAYEEVYSIQENPDDVKLVFEIDGYLRHLSIKDKLIICHSQDKHVTQLYVSDGTPEGTTELSEGVADNDVPYLFSSVGNYLFYTQDHGTPEYPKGFLVYDLMQSDLTPSGTVRVRTLYNDSTYYSYANNFTGADNVLFFTTAEPNIHKLPYPSLLYFYAPGSAQVTSNRIAKNVNISVYPNPAMDYCFVKTDFSGSIKLINSIGTVVSERDFDKTVRLDMSNLQSGIYLIKLESGRSETIITKILKE